VRRSTRASEPLPGLLHVSNGIKARDHDKKVEISNALEILVPIVGSSRVVSARRRRT